MSEANNKITIVAIDDDKDLLALIRTCLEAEGFAVATFSESRTALEQVRSIRPHCVLVDMNMPDMDGFETCLELRSMQELHDVPIVFLSATKETDRIVKALSFGANDYISKPFHPGELTARLESHVLLFEHKRQLEEQRAVLQRRNNENLVLNTRAVMLQEVIKQYTPRSTWEKADFSALSGMIAIPDESVEFAFLFLDIKSFTAFSERNEPAIVVAALNELLGPLTDIIYDNGGDVDKFIGDCIFAVFRDPRAAVRTGWLLRERARAVNIRRGERGYDELPVRIGMHFGRVVRGNIGGTARKENTMIGDAVNVTSRLEHACKPGELLISEDLYVRAKDVVDVSALIPAQLRGKTLSMSVRYVRGLLP